MFFAKKISVPRLTDTPLEIGSYLASTFRVTVADPVSVHFHLYLENFGKFCGDTLVKLPKIQHAILARLESIGYIYVQSLDSRHVTLKC
jgi:hypothetical protein